MRSRKSGGGSCTTMYCTNIDEFVLALKIRDYYLDMIGIKDQANDIQDRTGTEMPSLAIVEILVKKHCNLNWGWKPCDLGNFGTSHGMGYLAHNGREARSVTLYNKRVDIKKLSVRAHNYILEYFTPEALAKRKDMVDSHQRMVINAARMAESNKRQEAKKAAEKAKQDAAWKRGGRKRRTRKNK